MRIAVAIAALFGAQFAAAAIANLSRNADLAWQRWLGNAILTTHHIPRSLGAETFTSAGAPWVPQEALFSLAFTVAERVHLEALFAVAIALGAATALLLVALRARAFGAPDYAVWIAVFGCGVAMEQMFNVRAQVAAWPFLALVALLVERRDRWKYYAIPATALWANVHASAMLAPLLALRLARGRERVILACGSAIALLATPFGFDLPRYALMLMTSPIRGAIQEWRPSHPGDPALIFGFGTLLACMIAGEIGARRVRIRPIIIAVGTCIFAATAARNVPLAAIVLAPYAAAAFAWDTVPHRLAHIIDSLGRTRAFAVMALLLYAVIAWRTAEVATAAPASIPSAAIRAASHAAAHHLYCEDFAWCSLALGDRRLRTFLDGRADPFPANVWRDYLSIQQDPARRAMLLDRYGVDAVIASTRGALASSLRSNGHWRVVMSDARFMLLIRANAGGGERHKPEPRRQL